MSAPDRFNIRVYGLWLKNGRLLCCHEHSDIGSMTKFPGGGLEFGEGLVECLYREFLEETGVPLNSHTLFYANDFFQQSAFNPSDQLVSLYYLVDSDADLERANVTETRNGKPWHIHFEWLSVLETNEDQFTFPIDRAVFSMLKLQFRNKF